MLQLDHLPEQINQKEIYQFDIWSQDWILLSTIVRMKK